MISFSFMGEIIIIYTRRQKKIIIYHSIPGGNKETAMDGENLFLYLFYHFDKLVTFHALHRNLFYFTLFHFQLLVTFHALHRFILSRNESRVSRQTREHI